MKRYFSHTCGDIFTLHDTAEEAKAAAEEDLQDVRENLARYQFVEDDKICWGEIRGMVAATGEGEYELQDVLGPDQPSPITDIDRYSLRYTLRNKMSEISEDYQAAGWHDRLEYDLWYAVQRMPSPTEYGDDDIEQDALEIIRDISDRLGEWCDGEDFIALNKWLEIVEADKKRS